MISSSILRQADKLISLGSDVEEAARELGVDREELSYALKQLEGEEEVTSSEALAAKRAMMEVLQFSPNEALKLRAAIEIHKSRPFERRLRRREAENSTTVNLVEINQAILNAERHLENIVPPTDGPQKV